jgi:hypothetical protein
MSHTRAKEVQVVLTLPTGSYAILAELGKQQRFGNDEIATARFLLIGALLNHYQVTRKDCK